MFVLLYIEAIVEKDNKTAIGLKKKKQELCLGPKLLSLLFC